MNDDIFESFLTDLISNPIVDDSIRFIAERHIQMIRERQEQMKHDPRLNEQDKPRLVGRHEGVPIFEVPKIEDKS